MTEEQEEITRQRIEADIKELWAERSWLLARLDRVNRELRGYGYEVKDSHRRQSLDAERKTDGAVK